VLLRLSRTHNRERNDAPPPIALTANDDDHAYLFVRPIAHEKSAGSYTDKPSTQARLIADEEYAMRDVTTGWMKATMGESIARWRIVAGGLFPHKEALAAAAPEAVPVAAEAPAAAPPTSVLARRSAWLPRVRAALPRRLTPEWGIALLATALSIGFFAWYAHQGQTLAYSDAISHMMIARRVFFSRTPGLAQLGSVWLPLTHMLMLPFIWWDALFYSGLAGALPSMAGYVLGAVYLYRLARMVFDSVPAGVLAALAFMLNPNTLYMQSTPMTEVPMIGLAIIATYYAVRWARDFDARDLVKCAATTAAATLVRYDAWSLAVALGAILALIAWRRFGWRSAEANSLLFGALAFSGCVAWLIYQQIIVGNAFDFANGPYSAEKQQHNILTLGGLPTKWNPVLSLHIYSQVVLDTVSLPVLAIAAIGLLIWLLRSRWEAHKFPVVALLMPFVFNWYALVRGNSVLHTPEIVVAGAHNYFNVRYGMMMLPAIALFYAYFATWKRPVVLALATLVLVLGVSGTWFSTTYTLLDPLALPTHAARANNQEAAWLAAHCTAGPTLISESVFEVPIFYSHVPLSHFLTNASSLQFQQAMEHPERSAKCLVMEPDSVTYEPVWEGLHSRQDWRPYFKLVAQFDSALFYQRIAAPAQATGVAPTRTDAFSQSGGSSARMATIHLDPDTRRPT
jgi:dolichyl-phosphate-mannose-protein mannosyltransferase